MDLTVKASESNHVVNIYFIQMFLDRWAKRRFREAGINAPVSMIQSAAVSMFQPAHQLEGIFDGEI